MKYVLAINTGHGFYTHEDRERIPIFQIYGDIIILTNNSDADKWIQRVNGIEITKQKALIELENQFNSDKANTVRRLQQELSNEQVKTFNSHNFDSRNI
jgi:hypothetical protein